MATSISNYTVGTLTMLLIFAAVVVSYGLVDTSVFTVPDSSVLESFGDFDEFLGQVNQSASESYETTADQNLFDVLGALVLKALGAIRTFFNGLTTMQASIAAALGFLGIVAGLFVTYLIARITIRLAATFIFKFINKTEDENR